MSEIDRRCSTLNCRYLAVKNEFHLCKLCYDIKVGKLNVCSSDKCCEKPTHIVTVRFDYYGHHHDFTTRRCKKHLKYMSLKRNHTIGVEELRS